jgi:hypothetical protein
MKLTATLPDGAVKTLPGIRDWNFNWQESVSFQRYGGVAAGDRTG